MEYKRKLLKLECIAIGQNNIKKGSRSCFIKGKQYCINIKTGIIHDDSRTGAWQLDPTKIGIDYINFFMWDWCKCAKFKIINKGE